MRAILFFIGLTLMISSFIACVISFYLLLFGIPVYAAGAILVFLSNRTVKTKLLVTILPIALYIPLLFLFLNIYNHSTPKTILIPESLDGQVRIVYDEKCGTGYREIDDVKTLIIPKSGILILNEDFDGHINYKYFMVDSLANRTPIPQYSSKNRTYKKPYVLPGGSGKIRPPIEANTIHQEQKGITFTDFYIFNKDTIDHKNLKSAQKLDSLTTTLVNRCRLGQ